MQLYYLTDEQRMVMELARALAREKIAPIAAHHDETESYPEEAMRLLAQQGLMGIWVPEAYGGTDMGALAVSLVAEEIAWACAATATNWGATPLGGYPIVLAGTEEQKRRYLPRLAAGEILAAYSLSEPGAGSDAASLQTTAVRRGDRYVLNGTKLWCSNGSNAGITCSHRGPRRARGSRRSWSGGLPGRLRQEGRKMGIRLADRALLAG
jgi:butyryl-CoA dehydrogenase